MRTRAWIVAAVMCLSACVRPAPPLDPAYVDADATFVAHGVHGGFAVDRSVDAPMTRIDAAGLLGRPRPTFIVREGDAALAGLWLLQPGAVLARLGLDDGAPMSVVVHPAWVFQAIRLAIDTEAGRLDTGPFARVDGRAGIEELSRRVQTNLDIRGVYRATIFDAGNVPIGWFEVRAPSPDDPRV